MELICLNCGGPLKRGGRYRYCGKPECQKARNHVSGHNHRKYHEKRCRKCGADITGTNKAWCDDPECQAAKRKYNLTRIRELESERRKTGYAKHHAWGRFKKPTGRICRKCGLEIFQIKDGSGVIIFDGYFHCSACDDHWNDLASGFDENCIHMGHEWL